MKQIIFLTALVTLIAAAPGYADIYLSPWVGYTGGGSVVDQNEVEYDLKGSESYALTLETTLDKGRIGFFYGQQNSKVEKLNEKSTIRYLHLQSSVYYPVQDKFQAYVGVGLGASHVDVNWADNKYGFSASMFGGLEYQLTDTMALNSQLRWLGTVVDNETTGVCNLPTSESCVIRFKTDWMNQFSANIGFVIHF